MMRWTKQVALGVEALLIHARSGAGWGDGDDDELDQAVMAACAWIEEQADRRKTTGKRDAREGGIP